MTTSGNTVFTALKVDLVTGCALSTKLVGFDAVLDDKEEPGPGWPTVPVVSRLIRVLFSEVKIPVPLNLRETKIDLLRLQDFLRARGLLDEPNGLLVDPTDTPLEVDPPSETFLDTANPTPACVQFLLTNKRTDVMLPDTNSYFPDPAPPYDGNIPRKNPKLGVGMLPYGQSCFVLDRVIVYPPDGDGDPCDPSPWPP